MYSVNKLAGKQIYANMSIINTFIPVKWKQVLLHTVRPRCSNSAASVLLIQLLMTEMQHNLGILPMVHKSELLWPIPRNFVESDHGWTSRIYFNYADDNVTMTLYNRTMTLYNVTLTSQKPFLNNNKCDCRKTNGLNEVYGVFLINYFNKISP